MKQITILGAIIGFLIAVAVLGFTSRIDDGYIGISKNRFTGEISDQYIGQGITQTFTQEILEISTRNIIIPINGKPVAKEGLPMESFDVRLNYGINPNNAPTAYRTEKNQHTVNPDGDIFLLGEYVRTIAQSSISEVVRQYGAMEVNQVRDEVEVKIKDVINRKLEQQGKLKYVNVNEINVINIVPTTSIKSSIENIIKTENDKKSKQNEVEVARLEQEKMEILSKQADSQYIEYINATANAKTADALYLAASKGNLVTYIVPNNFTSLGQVGK